MQFLPWHHSKKLLGVSIASIVENTRLLQAGTISFEAQKRVHSLVILNYSFPETHNAEICAAGETGNTILKIMYT